MKRIISNINKLSKANIFLLSLLLLFLIGSIDYFTGIELSISVFYLLPVILCAWYVNKTSGLVLAMIAALIWFIADILTSKSYSHPVTPYWNALVMLGIFILINEIFAALKLSFERENQLAIKVQKGLLPKEVPFLDSLQISVSWKPLGHVSGDYYDFVKQDENKLGICIADVCGHGVAAALLMSNIQAGFHATIQSDVMPPNVCKKLNHIIKRHQLPDKFVSFFYGIIDLEEKSLIYSNAGHPPPIIIKQDGTTVRLSKGGTMLGVVSEYHCEYEKISLTDGDIILLYTDGITEAKNVKAELFGEENLINICKKNKLYDSHQIKNSILKAVNQFNSHTYDDDVTLLVIKYEN